MYHTGYNPSPDLYKIIAPTEVRKDRICDGVVRGKFMMKKLIY